MSLCSNMDENELLENNNMEENFCAVCRSKQDQTVSTIVERQASLIVGAGVLPGFIILSIVIFCIFRWCLYCGTTKEVTLEKKKKKKQPQKKTKTPIRPAYSYSDFLNLSYDGGFEKDSARLI